MTVHFGVDSFKQLPEILAQYSFDGVFVVTGTHSFEQPAVQSVISNILSQYPFHRFYGFDPNIAIADLNTGLEQFQQLPKPTLILAIGGGSILDMAKLIRFFAENKVDPIDYFTQNKFDVRERSTIPFIAVPTTAGTGSEATQFATLYIQKTKYSLDHFSVLPSEVILDPLLTMNLSPQVTATSGMDALTQAIESYWSTHAKPTSQRYAKEAVMLIHSNLKAAVLNPTLECREAMLKGAHLAGQAINLTRTTAAHALSYAMTAHFNIPHGQAVGITLPCLLEYNNNVSGADVLDPRGAFYVKQTLSQIVTFLGLSSIEDAKQALIALMQEIGLQTTLTALGIEHKDWALLIQGGLHSSRIKNNPRLLTEANLHDLFVKIEA